MKLGGHFFIANKIMLYTEHINIVTGLQHHACNDFQKTPVQRFQGKYIEVSFFIWLYKW